MLKRKQASSSIETEVVTRSARRCCLCYGLNNDFAIKKGQIAHLDQDSSNSISDNLVWLCFDHHDEYDTTTSQSKGLTMLEVKNYRDQLYDAIFTMRNAQNEKISDIQSFRVMYGSTPSNATVRTRSQFILVSVRKGAVENYMLDLIRNVLVDLELYNEEKLNKLRYYQQMMLRGVWFDDKHGNVTLHIDLLYDGSKLPSITIEDVQEFFHHGDAWYDGQSATVRAEIISVHPNSDSFFPISDEFYQRKFLWT